MRTLAASAMPACSRSKARRRTASPLPMRTNSLTTSPLPRGAKAYRRTAGRFRADRHRVSESRRHPLITNQNGRRIEERGRSNLFVVFDEPDIDIAALDTGELQVTVKDVDVYDPNTGDISSNGVRNIAARFIDIEYDEESFFVRHVYSLGANDPYKALKTALRAEIDKDAWASIYSARSRPFPRPRDGAFAVKLINHFGDEVMKVYRGYRQDAVSTR